MKKIFTLIAVAMLSLTTALAADGNYTHLWHHTLDGMPSPGDNVQGFAKAADGSVFVLSQICTGTAKLDYKDAPAASEGLNIYMDGQKLLDDRNNEIIGNNYKVTDGTSTAENALLQKVDPLTGQVKWNVWTDRGECYQGRTHVLAAGDGGAVLILYYRHWAEGKGDTLMRIHGTNGTVRTIQTTEGTWRDNAGDMHIYYVPVYVKVTADGEVADAKILFHVQPVTTLDHNPGWLSYTNSATMDADGNIYVCGNFRTTLTFDTEDGMEEEITARNVQGWNGDDQSDVGDMYLVKFNANGDYVASYTAQGTAHYANFKCITFAGGRLYATGLAQGDGTALAIGSEALTFPTTGQNMFVAAFDTGLKPVFATGYQVQNINALHQESLTVFDNTLWLAGSALSRTGGGDLQTMDGTTVMHTNLKTHQGYILKLSMADGSSLGSGVISATGGISKIFGLFKTRENGEDYINGWGYDMMAGGANIYKFETVDSGNLVNTDYTNVVNRDKGFAMVQTEPLVIGNTVVLQSRFGRSNTANATYQLLGGETTSPVNCWAVCLMAYTNPNLVDTDASATGIENVRRAAGAADDSRVFSITGRLVGTSTDNLPAGIYIQNGRKVVVK